MKKVILSSVSLLMGMLFTVTATAQTSLAPDQNPNYMVSQQKYMKMADSINTWHSTTPQETYKAIDFLADKAEAREQRRATRRELRMERARWGGDYYDGGYGGYNYYPNYNNGYYNNYNNGFYNNRYYRSYGSRNSWNNYFWNTLPLATGIGLASWWCR